MGIVVSTATDVCQVGGRYRSDQSRPRRDRRFRKRRLRDVPAHPDLYAKLGYQENCAGALPGGMSSTLVIRGRPPATVPDLANRARQLVFFTPIDSQLNDFLKFAEYRGPSLAKQISALQRQLPRSPQLVPFQTFRND
jgi:hypothetical protein